MYNRKFENAFMVFAMITAVFVVIVVGFVASEKFGEISNARRAEKVAQVVELDYEPVCEWELVAGKIAFTTTNAEDAPLYRCIDKQAGVVCYHMYSFGEIISCAPLGEH